MLTDIKVENFRGIRSLTLNNLGRITLIGGKNGVGKTALLEALWVFSGPDLPELSERINEMRGIPSFGADSVFRNMFFDYDTDSRIKIAARGDWEEDSKRALEIFLQERQHIDAIRHDNFNDSNSVPVERMTRPRFESETELVLKYEHNDGQEYISRAWWFTDQPIQAGSTRTESPNEGIVQKRQIVPNRADSIFMPAIHRENLLDRASIFTDPQLQGDVDKILPFIRILEPRIADLTLIAINNAPVIHARLEGMRRLIPVQLLGEGLTRMLGLALAMNRVSGGMLLIDEIENGLHYRVQEEVFSLLLSLAQAFDVQIFATTHSRECIIAAHEALNKGQRQEFAFYRLDRLGKEVKAVHFDDEMLDTSVKHGMEMR